MDWFRWYSGTFNDPKLQWIASKTKQPLAIVLAIWVAVLERANVNEVRGYCEGLDFESLDVVMGLDDGVSELIYQAMTRKGMIIDNKITAWEKRQVNKEDTSATDRQRNKRERDKLLQDNAELREQLESLLSQTQPINNHVTDVTDVTDVTVCHGMSRDVTECHDDVTDVTTEEIRLEEKREERNKTKVKVKGSNAGEAEPKAVVVSEPEAKGAVEQVKGAKALVAGQSSAARLRACVAEKLPVLQAQFPELDIGLETEELVAKFGGQTIGADPWLLVLRWFKAALQPRGRDRPSSVRQPVTFEQAKLNNTLRAMREFVEDHR